jgi:hypothetical protein
MSGEKTATKQRAAMGWWTTKGESSWGHQVAKQWGGPATQWNAVSATEAQEAYQTTVEDAVTQVAQELTLPLNRFRIKHTAYLYPGSHVAKYVRIKIYVLDSTGQWVKAIDQITKDNVSALAGGRSKPRSARGKLQIGFERQLKNALNGTSHLATKRTTSATTELSYNAARTPSRPAAPVAPAPAASGWKCFLTTACLEYRGLPDDCDELRILRDFRDGYLRSLPEGEELIEEYYRIAPTIVERIKRSDFAPDVFARLYDDLVRTCVDLIRAGNNREALEVYCAWVRFLKLKYLEGADVESPSDLLALHGSCVGTA